MLDQSRGRALALLTAVFIAGGAAGWGLGTRTTEARAHGPQDAQARLAYLLNLSPTQQESVQAVLDRYRDEMRAIWQASRPRIDSLRGIVQGEVYAQLTPVQQDQFRALVALHARERREADDVSEELLDPDHDGVPQRTDRCPDTKRGTPVDSLGCATHSDHASVK